MYRIYLIAFVLFLILATPLAAQDDDSRNKGRNLPEPEAPAAAAATKGIIRGQVLDKETGEPLMDATIRLEGFQTGALADIDGNYTIQGVPAGKQSITVSYISFANQTVTEIEVKPGQVTVINAYLVEETTTTEEVVINAKALKNTEASVLSLQRLSSVTLDGISSQQISRNGDSDAAAALIRVTGLTVESGRYVYVRGLGDRYNKTTVNGAEIPGLDPTRNSVQMDMFPSNIVDNLIVYKTFSPDLPGSYTGGLIDITTKDFPEKFNLYISTSYAYNTQSTFNKDFLLYDRGRTDWMGFDDGGRQEPKEARGSDNKLPIANTEYRPENQNDAIIDRASREFGGDMYPTTQNNFLDQNHVFSIGNQISLFGKPLGFIASVSYRRQYSYYKNGREALWSVTGSSAEQLNSEFNYSDERGEDAVLFGALGTFSYKLASNHKIALSFMRNHSGESSGRYQEGSDAQNAVGQIRENRIMQYLERSLNVAQLRGDHVFKDLAGLKVNWVGSLVYMRQDEPDLRFFSNQYEIRDDGSRSYLINTSQYNPPSRFYRSLDENGADWKLHLTLPVTKKLTLKSGGSFTSKFRVPFREKWYQYDGPDLKPYNGNPADYFAPDRLGANYETNNTWNLHLVDNSTPSNSYNGEESIYAAYGMGDYEVAEWLRIVAGVRLEVTRMIAESLNPALPVGKINTQDPLPALGLIFRPRKDANIRVNYGRTVARPIMREMAPYSNFDFIGAYQIIGNANLKRTLIDNFDLRLEWFPSAVEVVSVSAFYKAFQNPIERAIDTRAGGGVQIQFRNVDQASVYGLEFEFRRSLGFLYDRMKHFQAGVNLSLVRSLVDISPLELENRREFISDAPSQRPMFGQSPYIINSTLGYVNPEKKTSITMNFNIFGERISEVGIGSRPDVYEQPRPDLGINIQQGVGELLTFRLGATNLLNPRFYHVQGFKDDEQVFREFRTGVRIVFGVAYQIK